MKYESQHRIQKQNSMKESSKEIQSLNNTTNEKLHSQIKSFAESLTIEQIIGLDDEVTKLVRSSKDNNIKKCEVLQHESDQNQKL